MIVLVTIFRRHAAITVSVFAAVCLVMQIDCFRRCTEGVLSTQLLWAGCTILIL